MYFICCLSGCGMGPTTFFKILIEQMWGVGCVFTVSCPAFLAWSVVANLPNNGVLLHLQNLICKDYFIWIAILGLASVPCRSFRKFWVLLLLDLGTENGPSVHMKLHSTLTTVAFLWANLKLGVCVLMDVHSLRGCEMVGWVSKKSGCLLFPVIVMSIN